MAHVLELAPLDEPRPREPNGTAALKNLDVGFLVHAQHDLAVLGEVLRPLVAPEDGRRLLAEVGVQRGRLPVTAAVGLQLCMLEDDGDLGVRQGRRDAALAGHPRQLLPQLRGRFVFCQEDGQPLTEGKMMQPLRRALNRAGISREEGRIGWHDLRHTYASHRAMRGVPLKVIQELMGHVTIEMTERYAHLSPDTRREAVGVLDRPLPPAPACDIRATRMEGAANHP